MNEENKNDEKPKATWTGYIKWVLFVAIIMIFVATNPSFETHKKILWESYFARFPRNESITRDVFMGKIEKHLWYRNYILCSSVKIKLPNKELITLTYGMLGQSVFLLDLFEPDETFMKMFENL